jgi:hypothetical protein
MLKNHGSSAEKCCTSFSQLKSCPYATRKRLVVADTTKKRLANSKNHKNPVLEQDPHSFPGQHCGKKGFKSNAARKRFGGVNNT